MTIAAVPVNFQDPPFDGRSKVLMVTGYHQNQGILIPFPGTYQDETYTGPDYVGCSESILAPPFLVPAKKSTAIRIVDNNIARNVVRGWNTIQLLAVKAILEEDLEPGAFLPELGQEHPGALVLEIPFD